MTQASRVSQYAAQGETSGTENGQCEFCERKGLPILPVRYAVCQRNDRNRPVPELPEERIREFTDIGLDKAWDENGQHIRTVDDEVRPWITDSTSSQVNKYILRQLRQGYLYFYDQDNPDGMYWYAYAITSDGKYYQFPVAQPPHWRAPNSPVRTRPTTPCTPHWSHCPVRIKVAHSIMPSANTPGLSSISV